MKKVFKTSAEVAHMWASQSQESGRAGNTSFHMSGKLNVFYSYSTVIAKVIGDYVIIDRHTYSNTTTGHYSDVIWAFRGVKKVLRVYGVDSGLDYSFRQTNIEINQLLNKASRARERRDSYLAQAKALIDDYNVYAKLMKGKAKDQIKIDIENFSPEQHAAALKVEEARQAKAQARLVAKRKRELKDEIRAWRAGDASYLGRDVPTMLRLSKDGTEVETSHSARIPVADALKLWPIILRCKSGAREFEPGMPLGSYRLTKILRSGDIVVGCHEIAFAEIEGVARQLGLTSSSKASQAQDKAVAA